MFTALTNGGLLAGAPVVRDMAASGPRRRSCQSSAAPDHESGQDILGRRASCNATVPLRCNGSAQ
jgi:hypothetical protein